MKHEDFFLYLDAAKKDFELIKTIYKNKNIESQLAEIQLKTLDQAFWSRKDAENLMSELSRLSETKSNLNELESKLNEAIELLELFGDQSPESTEIFTDLKQISKRLTGLKLKLILSGPYDSNPCFIAVNPGAGGTESQDWAQMLVRMYIRFCERSGFNVKIIDLQNADEAGIKTATLSVNGPNAYGILRSESGVHRLVRISPFDSAKRRHTSFASVHVSPEVPDNQITISPDQLRIDTYRASGAGGQHVNTTDSAVRITHLPTNTVTQCQSERSQGQNKQQAMKMLMAKLVEIEEQKKQDIAAQQEKKKIEWGSQIRSYVLHPYKMVKDHRSGYESPQPEIILDGKLEDFINAYLQEFN